MRAAGRETVEPYIAAHPQGPRPHVDADVVARFRDRALSLMTSIEDVQAIYDIPSAVARYLREQDLPAAAVCWPGFATLDWRALGLQVEARAARDSDLVGITGVFCALAETGTLMMCSGAETPSAGGELHLRAFVHCRHRADDHAGRVWSVPGECAAVVLNQPATSRPSRLAAGWRGRWPQKKRPGGAAAVPVQ